MRRFPCLPPSTRRGEPPLPALRGERVGVRGCFRTTGAKEDSQRVPLTRIASAMRSDLSPHAGRGEEECDKPVVIARSDSDEAIHGAANGEMVCFASLAMTG